MKVLVDETIGQAKRREIEAIVIAAIGARPDSESLVVSVVKLNPGRGWSIFINDVQDPPLVEAIETALKNGGF